MINIVCRQTWKDLVSCSVLGRFENEKFVGLFVEIKNHLITE